MKNIKKIVRTIKESDLTTMEKKVYNNFKAIGTKTTFNRQWVKDMIAMGEKAQAQTGVKEHITGFNCIERIAQILKEERLMRDVNTIKVYFSEEAKEAGLKLSLQGMGQGQQCQVLPVKEAVGGGKKKAPTVAQKANKVLKAGTKDSGSIEGLERVFHKQNKEAQTMELIVLIKGSKIDGSLQQRLLEQFDVLVIEQADKLIALNVA